MRKIRIGSGAGFSGDRIEPALILAERGDIQYLIFECLAERTIALAQQQKDKDPQKGFDPLLEERFLKCLPECHKKKIKIITNMGAANPLAAMEKICGIAGSLGIKNLKVAAVTGDDVLEQVKNMDYTILENGEPLETINNKIISANAYLGAKPIVEALSGGADVIVTGRVSDPALFIAPLIYEFGWAMDDYHIIGKATLIGHLLECAGQVTGGYFADPDFKNVPDIANLGFPIAEVDEKGEFFVTKPANTGGMVTTATCKEQMIYEIHDPKNYITPDVIADFSNVSFRQIDVNKVAASGSTGKEKTGKYKVSIGYKDSFIGEGQISYGGLGCVERAKMALAIVKERLSTSNLKDNEARYDIIGTNSLYGNSITGNDPIEVRARIAVRTSTMNDAIKVGNEVESLYTNGPAGGGGVVKSAREIIAIKSILIDADKVKPMVKFKTV